MRSVKLHAFLSTFFIVSGCRSTNVLPNLNDDSNETLSGLEGNNSGDAKAVQRFQSEFDLIRSFYASVPKFSDMPEKMIAADIRSTFMRIEAIARTYQSHFKEGSDDYKRLKELFDYAAKVEDNLGTLSDIVKLPAVLESAKAPADLINYANKKSARTIPQFIPFLEKFGWSKDLKTLTEMEKLVRKIDWPGKKDNEVVFTQIAKEAKDIAEKNYPLNDINNGVHRLRKDLRWILLEIRGSNGLIVRDDNSCAISEYQALVNAPIATSKYGVLPPNPRETTSCELNGCIFLAVATHNDNIAVVKDLGLWEEQIENLLKEYKPDMSKDAIKQTAKQIIMRYPNYRDPTAVTTAELAKIKKTGVLVELAKELKNCRPN